MNNVLRLICAAMIVGLVACTQNPERAIGDKAVRAALKDPDSAKFEDTFVYYDTAGNGSYCGTVNARNGFGAYAGKQRFYVSMAKRANGDVFVVDLRLEGSEQSTRSDREMFEMGWASNCGKG